MNGKIFKFFKDNISIIGGFLAGILSISIGISIFNDSAEYSKELNFGNYKYENAIMITYDYKELTIENEIKNIISESGKDSTIIYGSTILKINDEVLTDRGMIMPIAYSSGWLPNIIYGRHLTYEETISDEKVAVVGIDVFRSLGLTNLDKDSRIIINDTEFKIIGVMGRSKRFIELNKQIFIPFRNFSQANKYDQSKVLLTYSNIENSNKILNELKQIDNLTIEEIKPNEKLISTIELSYKLIVILGILILISASVNMSSVCTLKFYKRRKEFAIRKAIGSTDKMIAYIIFKDIFLSILLACIGAFLFQIVFMNSIEGFLVNMELNFTKENILIGMALTFFLSVTSAWIPIKKSLRVDISEEIK
ncbi:MAG: ABC transporter permease [Aeromonas sp.]